MKEMQWREHNGKLALYVCDEHTKESWVHHKQHPAYLREYHATHSDGWSTYQRLHKLGYRLLPTAHKTIY